MAAGAFAWDIPSSGMLDDAGNRQLSAGQNTFDFGSDLPSVYPTLIPFLIISLIGFYIYKKVK